MSEALTWGAEIGQLKKRIAELEKEVKNRGLHIQKHCEIQDNQYEEIERLRSAHEQIIRECDSLNKGPRAVMISKAALGEK